ncbi:MAG: HAMP domain-containing histidine kinase [Thermoplasmata archaeon]|nr:HAMP domain-containing histidine kinase [Thermoplasmata archaeon]
MSTEQRGSDKKEQSAGSECLFYLDLMSHEVQNFNQAVLGYLELIQNDASINEDMKHYLITAIHQVRNSSQLIDDVKKIAHLGMVSEEMFESMSLNSIVEDAVSYLKKEYPGKNILIDTTTPGDTIRIKATDALTDVVFNLLSNAVKFDTSDEVHIGVKISPADGKAGMIDLAIEDRGPGIPDNLKKILSSEMPPDEKTKTVRGMGLLLARAATKRFGGRLIISDRVQGDHTQGAKVIIRLPEVRSR